MELRKALKAMYGVTLASVFLACFTFSQALAVDVNNSGWAFKDWPKTGADSVDSGKTPSYTKLDASGNELANSATDWVTVRDNVTGLVWEVKTDSKDANDSGMNLDWCDQNPSTNGGNSGLCGGGDTEAWIDYLNDNDFGGFNDWRIPTVKELSTLVDYSRSAPPFINTDYFPNQPTDDTLPPNLTATSEFADWYLNVDVSFGTGVNMSDKSTSVGLARAVRAGSLTNNYNGTVSDNDGIVWQQANSTTVAFDMPRLTDNGNGTVTDQLAGLVWQQAAATTTGITYQQAEDHCQSLTVDNLTWRLPTMNELQGLADYSKPADGAFLPPLAYNGDTFDAFYTTTTFDATRVFGVEHMWIGNTLIMDKSATETDVVGGPLYSHFARCVAETKKSSIISIMTGVWGAIGAKQQQ